MTRKPTPQILLWVGELPADVTPDQCRGCELLQVNKTEEAFSFLGKMPIAVLVAALKNQDENLDLLEKWEQESPLTSLILVAESMSATLIRDSVNRAHVLAVLERKKIRETWPAVFTRAVTRSTELVGRANLLRESTKQFRELEALNMSLEKIVSERTQHIELSKREEEEKLNKVRTLTRFIKEMAQVSSFEEFLLQLRRELRKFHKVGDPILIYQLFPGKVEFVSIQGGQIVLSSAGGEFPFSGEMSLNQKSVSKSLANQFGRPFAKTLMIPVEPGLVQESHGPHVKAAVCVEYSVKEQELSQVLDFVQERLQPLSLTVDRLLLESELTKFSFRWEKTFDGIKDPIAIIDVDYEVLRSNKKFSKKLSRKKCYESLAGRTSPCEGCPIEKSFSSGQPQRSQIQVGEKTYEVHSYPIRLQGGGKATNAVHQYVDITQSRELYLRLLQSEKMGAIGLLAGNIAHELNNPLTGLRSLSQVLLDEAEKDSNISNDLREIEKAAGRSQQIIRNLREFSQGVTQEVRPISLDDIIQKTIPMLKAVMRIHRQEFDLQAKNFFIAVEPQMIQQVVFNLVNNACQAMKDPGILSVKTWHEPSTRTVHMSVADTGTGIPPKILEKIFEPFFTTKKEGLGTGLGLSLAKKIVETYSGRIEVKTEEGKGSTFHVFFPEAERAEEGR
jgi:signal transduction histidine kinase